MKNISAVFLCVFSIFSTCCCQQENTVSQLSINYDDPRLFLGKEMEQNGQSLIACSRHSVYPSITNPQKEPYLYYRFPKELLRQLNSSSASVRNTMLASLEITVRVDEFTENGNFAIAFLTEKDFFAGKLKKELDSRPLVSGRLTRQNTENGTVTVSCQIPGKEELKSEIAGFAVFSLQKITLTYVRVYQTKIGWTFSLRNPWFGYGTKGGVLPASLDEAQNAVWDFDCGETDFSKENRKIYIELENIVGYGENPPNSKRKVKMRIADIIVNFYPDTKRRTVSLNTIMFQNKIQSVSFTENSWCVKSLVFEPSKDADKRPISTDPGLIRSWPKDNWQNENYELFSWEEFPSILIFDFANYEVQDRYLKRLAFFVEKKGFVGTLMTNEQIAPYHAYNAHDYKSDSLASFFTKAESTRFSLNAEELELKEILLENGIIVQGENGYEGNNGAIVSLSKESADYLRSTFICHEGMHGVFFIDEDFRKYIYYLYGQTDSDSIDFIKSYFRVTPSLNYDISNDYLLKNEFMGYLFQQPLSEVGKYFGTTLASRKFINEYCPEIAEKTRENQGQGFVKAGKMLDDYVFRRWGFNLGRNWKITLTTEE